MAASGLGVAAWRWMRVRMRSGRGQGCCPRSTRVAGRPICALRHAGRRAPAGVLLPQISLNGQDETSSSLPFRFYDPPALLALSPTTGPALGGTLVDVRGANFTRQGTLPVCRFGGALWRRAFGALSALTTSDALQGAHGVGARALHGLPPNEVPATIVNATHALCLTPPSVRGPMLELALELALNGHDFTSDNLRFRYLTDRTSLISVFPTSDSSLGGRPLLLSGRGLANGSDVRCRYRAPTLGVVETRALELGGSGLMLMCPAPAVPPGMLAAARSRVSDAVSTALPLTLDVTLNGQQYSLAPSLRFEIIAGEEPSPRLLGVRPSLGPANGSSLVLISGVLLEFGSHLLCRFGEGGGAPTVDQGDSAPDVGAAIVRASYDAATGDLHRRCEQRLPNLVGMSIEPLQLRQARNINIPCIRSFILATQRPLICTLGSSDDTCALGTAEELDRVEEAEAACPGHRVNGHRREHAASVRLSDRGAASRLRGRAT